jgi:hypothetical protein
MSTTTETVVDAIVSAGEAVDVGVMASNTMAVVERKQVAFLVDVESKAIVETCADLENFNVSSMMTVLPKLIKHVENYKNLRGEQKRALVISMLKHIIDITDGPGNDDIWDPILKQLVPSLIDTLIEVNDGKLKLRKKPKCFGKLLLCCGGGKNVRV